MLLLLIFAVVVSFVAYWFMSLFLPVVIAGLLALLLFLYLVLGPGAGQLSGGRIRR